MQLSARLKNVRPMNDLHFEAANCGCHEKPHRTHRAHRAHRARCVTARVTKHRTARTARTAQNETPHRHRTAPHRAHRTARTDTSHRVVERGVQWVRSTSAKSKV